MMMGTDEFQTIIECDRACVMDTSQIAEFDTPARLFEDGISRGTRDCSGIFLEDIQRAAKFRGCEMVPGLCERAGPDKIFPVSISIWPWLLGVIYHETQWKKIGWPSSYPCQICPILWGLQEHQET